MGKYECHPFIEIILATIQNIWKLSRKFKKDIKQLKGVKENMAPFAPKYILSLKKLKSQSILS